MDAYTKELLALVVERAPGNHVCIGRGGYAGGSSDWHVMAPSFNATGNWFGPTLADALTALLRDLGIEPPERPSAERVQRELMRFENLHPEDDWDIDDLRDLYAREPLTVIALLEGCPS